MELDVADDGLTELIFSGVREALRTEDSAAFLAWMRVDAPRRFPEVFDRFPAELASRMACWLGVAIWNVTPLPGNGFRPRPLPPAQRNQPCVCGSGRKLKHCCGERPPLPRIPDEVAWEAVLPAVPMTTLREAAAAGRLPVQQLGRVAQHLLDVDKPRQALALVEPLFERPELADESFSAALEVLFTSYLVLGRQRQREQVVERLTRELHPPLRAQAWMRRATMLADQGRHDEAWTAWEQAHQDDPNAESLVQLELTLLLARGSLDRAAERARFHLKRLGRRGKAELAMPELLEAVAADPLAIALQLSAGDAWRAARRLAGIAQAAAAQPIELRYTVAPDRNDPAIGTLVAAADLNRLERSWRQVFPLDEAGLSGAIWEEAVAEHWLDFLAANEAALDSFEVLFDLAVVAPKVLGGPGAAILGPRLEPLVQRAMMILDRLLAATPQLELAAGTPTHRAVIALLAAQVQPAAPTDAAGRDARLTAVERLVRLMPDEPMMRETLATLYLSRGANQQALDAAGSGARHQDGILDFCRTLALYRLGRKGEALAELSRVAMQLPEMAHHLALTALPRQARRRTSPADAAAGSPEDLLRLLLHGEPELHLWLQELAAKIKPRPRRQTAAATGGKGTRPPAGIARRPAGPRPARTQPAVRATASPPAEPARDARLRLKVTLLGTRPPIWRRLEVARKLTLGRFHHVLQVAMGWTDSHLHAFIAGRQRYSDPSFGLDPAARNERRTTLGEVLRRRGDRIDYEYDFGDGWEHRIELEEVLPPQPGAPAAACVAGRRRCPPEDCGGVGGFAELLFILQGGDSPERRERLDWLGGELDPAAFDAAEVNRQLSGGR